MPHNRINKKGHAHNVNMLRRHANELAHQRQMLDNFQHAFDSVAAEHIPSCNRALTPSTRCPACYQDFLVFFTNVEIGGNKQWSPVAQLTPAQKCLIADMAILTSNMSQPDFVPPPPGFELVWHPAVLGAYRMTPRHDCCEPHKVSAEKGLALAYVAPSRGRDPFRLPPKRKTARRFVRALSEPTDDNVSMEGDLQRTESMPDLREYKISRNHARRARRRFFLRYKNSRDAQHSSEEDLRAKTRITAQQHLHAMRKEANIERQMLVERMRAQTKLRRISRKQRWETCVTPELLGACAVPQISRTADPHMMETLMPGFAAARSEALPSALATAENLMLEMGSVTHEMRQFMASFEAQVTSLAAKAGPALDNISLASRKVATTSSSIESLSNLMTAVLSGEQRNTISEFVVLIIDIIMMLARRQWLSIPTLALRLLTMFGVDLPSMAVHYFITMFTSCQVQANNDTTAEPNGSDDADTASATYFVVALIGSILTGTLAPIKLVKGVGEVLRLAHPMSRVLSSSSSVLSSIIPFISEMIPSALKEWTAHIFPFERLHERYVNGGKLRQLLEKVEVWKRTDYRLKMNWDRELQDEVLAAYDDLRSLKYAFVEQTRSSPQKFTLLLDAVRILEGFAESINYTRYSMSRRMEPYVIEFTGKPGVGKSYIAPDFISAVCPPSMKHNQCYARTAQKFWPGYNGQFCVRTDDFMAMTPNVNAESNEYIDLIAMKSTCSFFLNMPDVRDKGKKYFCSPLVMMCSNCAYVNVPNVQAGGMPYWRRRDMLVEMFVKPEFTKKGTDMFDRVKADAWKLMHPGEAWDFHTFRLLNPVVPGDHGFDQKTYTTPELIGTFKQRFSEHIKYEQKALLESMANEHVTEFTQRELEVCREIVEAAKDFPGLYNNALPRIDPNLVRALGADAPGLPRILGHGVEPTAEAHMMSVQDNYHDAQAEVPLHIPFATPEEEQLYDEWRAEGYNDGYSPLRMMDLEARLQAEADAILAREAMIAEVEASSHAIVHRAHERHPRKWAFTLLKALCVLLMGIGAAFTIDRVTRYAVQKLATPKEPTVPDRVVTAGAYDVGSSPSPLVKKEVVRTIATTAITHGADDPGAMALIEGPLATSLVGLSARVEQESGLVVNVSMHAMMIGGTDMLTVQHFFATTPGNYLPEGTKLQIRTSNGAVYSDTFQRNRLVTFDGADLALYRFSANVRSFRDIRSLFIHKSDLTKVPQTPALFLTKRGLTDMPYLSRTVAHARDHNSDSDKVIYDIFKGGSVPHVMQHGWKAAVAATNGDCGCPLIAENTHLDHKILGIHNAMLYNKSFSYFELVMREDLDELQNALNKIHGASIQPAEPEFPPLVEISTPTAISHGRFKTAPTGNFEIIGVVPSHLAAHQPMKHSHIPSPIFGKVFPNEKDNSVLSPNDDRMEEKISPMWRGVHKYGRIIEPFDNNILQVIEDDLVAQYSLLPFLGPRRLLTINEAVGGLSFPYFDGMNMSTSAGYGWKDAEGKPKNAHGKSWMFHLNPETERYEVTHQPLVDACHTRLANAFEGKRTLTVWTATLKDELRKESKIKSGSTRIFTNPPVDYTIVFRQLFLPFVCLLYQNHIKGTSSCVGIDPESLEWNVLVDELKKTSSFIIDLDYEFWDGFFAGNVMSMFSRVCTRVMKDYENKLARDTLILEQTHFVLLLLNLIILMLQGNTSGGAATSVINSFGNDVKIKYLWMKLAPEGMRSMEMFRKHVRCAFYGDDALLAVSPAALPFFNFDTIQSYFKSMGITVTMANKTLDSVPYGTIDTVQFLKRRFAKNAVGQYVPLMDLSTLASLTNWITRTPIGETEQCLLNCNCCLDFAFFYGYDYFMEVQERIIRAFNDRHLVTVGIKTYQDCIEKFYRSNYCARTAGANGRIRYQHSVTMDFDSFCSRCQRAVNPSFPALHGSYAYSSSALVEFLTCRCGKPNQLTTGVDASTQTSVQAYCFEWKRRGVFSEHYKLEMLLDCSPHTCDNYDHVTMYRNASEYDQSDISWISPIVGRSVMDVLSELPGQDVLILRDYKFHDHYRTAGETANDYSNERKSDASGPKRLQTTIEHSLVSLTQTQHKKWVINERNRDLLLRTYIQRFGRLPPTAEPHMMSGEGMKLISSDSPARSQDIIGATGQTGASSHHMDTAWTLNMMAEKPTYIGTVNYVTTNVPFTASGIIQRWMVPFDLLTTSTNTVPFLNMTFWKGEIIISFNCQGSKFHLGKVIAFFVPLSSTVSIDAWQALDPASMTALNHVFMDVTESTTAELHIPYSHPYDQLLLTDADGTSIQTNLNYLGHVYLCAFNQLTISSTATAVLPITVFASFRNNSFTVTKPAPSVGMQAPLAQHTRTRTSSVSSEFLTVEEEETIRQMRNGKGLRRTATKNVRVDSDVPLLAGQEPGWRIIDDDEALFPAAGIHAPPTSEPNMMAAAAEHLPGVIGLATKGIEAIANRNQPPTSGKVVPTNSASNNVNITVAGNDATQKDAPSLTNNGTPTLRQPFPFMRHSSDLNQFDMQALHPEYTKPYQPQNTGSAEDLMNALTLARKPCCIGTIAWNTSVTSGTQLSLPNSWIMPFPHGIYSTNGLGKQITSPYSPALVDWITAVGGYQWWSGELEISFQIVASPFAKGRLQFFAHYGQTAFPATFAGAQSQYGTMFELGADQKEFTFRLLPNGQTAWKLVANGSAYNFFEGTKGLDYGYGVMSLWVVNPLVVPSNIPPLAYINVFWRAGKNFALKGLYGKNTSILPMPVAESDVGLARSKNDQIDEDGTGEVRTAYPNMMEQTVLASTAEEVANGGIDSTPGILSDFNAHDVLPTDEMNLRDICKRFTKIFTQNVSKLAMSSDIGGNLMVEGAIFPCTSQPILYNLGTGFKPHTKGLMGALSYMFRGCTGNMRFMAEYDSVFNSGYANMGAYRPFAMSFPTYQNSTLFPIGNNETGPPVAYSLFGLKHFLDKVVGDSNTKDAIAGGGTAPSVPAQNAGVQTPTLGGPAEPRVAIEVPDTTFVNFLLRGADRPAADNVWGKFDIAHQVVIGAIRPNIAPSTQNVIMSVYMAAGDNFQFHGFLGIPPLYLGYEQANNNTTIYTQFPDVWPSRVAAPDAYPPAISLAQQLRTATAHMMEEPAEQLHEAVEALRLAEEVGIADCGKNFLYCEKYHIHPVFPSAHEKHMFFQRHGVGNFPADHSMSVAYQWLKRPENDFWTMIRGKTPHVRVSHIQYNTLPSDSHDLIIGCDGISYSRINQPGRDFSPLIFTTLVCQVWEELHRRLTFGYTEEELDLRPRIKRFVENKKAVRSTAPVSIIHEICQQWQTFEMQWDILSTTGPSHSPTHRVALTVRGGAYVFSTVASGPSMKLCKNAAAEKFLLAVEADTAWVTEVTKTE